MPRKYKVIRQFHRALLCYQEEGAQSWTVETDYPVQMMAKAMAVANALNIGADPATLTALALSPTAAAEIRRLQVERWRRLQEKNKQGHQHGLFDEGPPTHEDPPEDAYEAEVSKDTDPDIPF